MLRLGVPDIAIFITYEKSAQLHLISKENQLDHLIFQAEANDKGLKNWLPGPALLPGNLLFPKPELP